MDGGTIIQNNIKLFQIPPTAATESNNFSGRHLLFYAPVSEITVEDRIRKKQNNKRQGAKWKRKRPISRKRKVRGENNLNEHLQHIILLWMFAKKTQTLIIQKGNGLVKQVACRAPDTKHCFFKAVGWRCGAAFITAKAYLSECLDCLGMWATFYVEGTHHKPKGY